MSNTSSQPKQAPSLSQEDPELLAEFEQRIKDNQSFVTRVLDQPRLDLRFSH